eukprot:scaffold1452_cov117-Isochrysis_galbana.AAC.6
MRAGRAATGAPPATDIPCQHSRPRRAPNRRHVPAAGRSRTSPGAAPRRPAWLSFGRWPPGATSRTASRGRWSSSRPLPPGPARICQHADNAPACPDTPHGAVGVGAEAVPDQPVEGELVIDVLGGTDVVELVLLGHGEQHDSPCRRDRLGRERGSEVEHASVERRMPKLVPGLVGATHRADWSWTREVGLVSSDGGAICGGHDVGAEEWTDARHRVGDPHNVHIGEEHLAIAREEGEHKRRLGRAEATEPRHIGSEVL